MDYYSVCSHVCVWESCNGWTSCLAHWRWAWLNAVGGVEEQRKQPRRWMRRGATEPCWYFIIWIMNRAATWLSAWWRSYRRVGGGLSSHHKSQIHSCFQLARLCFSFRSIHWTLLASKATRNHVTPDKASFCANSNSALIWAFISKCFSSWTINDQFLSSFFLSVLTVFPPLFLVSSSFFPSFPSLYSFVLSLSFLLSFILLSVPSSQLLFSFFFLSSPLSFILSYHHTLLLSFVVFFTVALSGHPHMFFSFIFLNFVFTSKCYCFSFLPAPPNY